MRILFAVLVNVFLPLLLISLTFSIPVFLIARKRKLNPWGWTILTFCPFVGWIFAIAFCANTVLSILDRLAKIESETNFS